MDADVAVYIDEASTSAEVLADLHARLRTLLVEAYPNKKTSDFSVQPRTLGIHFVDSGLDVDLVPIIPVGGRDDYGYQPSSRGEPFVLTSVPLQLEFIRKHRDAYSDWSTVVRLLKRWRNWRELWQLRSFAIELIVCFLQDRDGVPGSIGEALSRFWLFVSQELSSTTVFFNTRQAGNGVGKAVQSAVNLIDPVNKDNNVTHRITESELDELVSVAEESWELFWSATDVAAKGATLEYLRQVFGRNFVIGD